MTRRNEGMSEIVGLLVQFLKIARLSRGESQKTVAQRMGVSQGRLWDLEQGRTEPTIPTLERWADALDLDLTFTLTSRLEGRGNRTRDSITAPRTEWYGTAKDLDNTLNGGSTE